MAEHWIDAASAANLVSDGPSGIAGRHALCARAHRGLVQARARLLVLTDRGLVSRQEHVAVPAEFWGAETEALLEQDWAAGDFSAQLESGTQAQAFGVTFAMSGMLDLLPADKRALAARQLSVAGNPAWVTARAARQFAYNKAGVNPAKAAAVVLDQAELGFVTARAVLAQRFDAGRHSQPPAWDRPPAWEAREWDIPVSYWRDFKVGRQGVHDWERGIFSGAGRGLNGQCLMKLTGVYILRESLQSLLPAAVTVSRVEEVPNGAPAKDNPGGRPTAEWWDDLWCHVMGQIYAGALTPNSQKAIEDAMHTWANDRGHEPAVSTIRLRARKLYRVLKEVENSLDK